MIYISIFNYDNLMGKRDEWCPGTYLFIHLLKTGSEQDREESKPTLREEALNE